MKSIFRFIVLHLRRQIAATSRYSVQNSQHQVYRFEGYEWWEARISKQPIYRSKLFGSGRLEMLFNCKLLLISLWISLRYYKLWIWLFCMAGMLTLQCKAMTRSNYLKLIFWFRTLSRRNNSFCEAFHFGVPQIIIPIFNDQVRTKSDTTWTASKYPRTSKLEA